MPGGSLVADYGLPAFYGDLLVEAVNNGSVPFSRVEDMVARVWRYMFSLGVVDENYKGNSTGIVRSAAHLKVARDVAAEGQVLLMNKDNTLPLSPKKYKSIAVIGADATQLAQGQDQGLCDNTHRMLTASSDRKSWWVSSRHDNGDHNVHRFDQEQVRVREHNGYLFGRLSWHWCIRNNTKLHVR